MPKYGWERKSASVVMRLSWDAMILVELSQCSQHHMISLGGVQKKVSTETPFAYPNSPNKFSPEFDGLFYAGWHNLLMSPNIVFYYLSDFVYLVTTKHALSTQRFFYLEMWDL